MHTVTKQYRDFPAAHRQPNHDGHCRLIHGHNWGWDITFTCDALDENGFVVDVGKLGEVKKMLTEHFDHTLLLNKEDPELTWMMSRLQDTLGPGVSRPTPLARIVIVPNCGMEGLAEFVFKEVMKIIDADIFGVAFERNLRVQSVTCWEDSKNSATWTPNL